MYLEHFGLQALPFHLTPNTDMFLGLPPHYEAIQTVNSALEMGEGVIKVTGEVGTGKTMTCRVMVKYFKPHIQLVFLPNPALDGDQLRAAVATELGIQSINHSSIVDDIQHKLIALTKKGKKVVMLIDEAQALSDDALEVLRLFGNIETERTKLIQIVLFGQPELDERLLHHHLRQLAQRITFSATLRGLTLDEVVAYIDNRLEKSGGDSHLFSLGQKKAIWKASRGVPRLVNQICNKALVLASVTKNNKVTNRHLFEAIQDTNESRKPRFRSPFLLGWV